MLAIFAVVVRVAAGVTLVVLAFSSLKRKGGGVAKSTLPDVCVCVCA